MQRIALRAVENGHFADTILSTRSRQKPESPILDAAARPTTALRTLAHAAYDRFAARTTSTGPEAHRPPCRTAAAQ